MVGNDVEGKYVNGKVVADVERKELDNYLNVYHRMYPNNLFYVMDKQVFFFTKGIVLG